MQQKQNRRVGGPGFAIEELETVDVDGVNGDVLGSGGDGGCGHDELLVGGGDGFSCGPLAFRRNRNNLLFKVTPLRWNCLSVRLRKVEDISVENSGGRP
jgi:hypothetical protein